MAVLMAGYMFAFFRQLDGRWFNPEYTTDDALQQSYIFHEVFSPGFWDGDLITTVMRGYLAPLHYWLTYAATWVTGSPIQGGHVVMALQALITCGFLLFGVRAFCGSAVPGMFAVVWFLHTRTVVQRFTGGLPRGWAAPVFAAFLYCVATGRHTLMLFCLLCGCMLHPPGTFLAGAAYGVWLLVLVAGHSRRAEGIRALKRLVLLCPLYLIVTLIVVHRPAEIGQMVDYDTASQMPAFGPRGRFAFLPLPSASRHIRTYGYNAFLMRLHDPGDFLKTIAPYFVFGSLLLFAILAWNRRRELVPASVWAYFAAIVSVYLVSRQVVFKLYVPDRHLLIPMTFFLIVAFTVASWRLAAGPATWHRLRQCAVLVLLAGVIFLFKGTGLVQDCNFNYHIYRKGKAFEWLRENTPEKSVIAGHPTHIDPVMLFAKRRGYVTSETAHPFYPIYYAEMERRLAISLKAHYALTVNEFLSLLKGEGIDYYVFSRMRFYGRNLKTETYYRPLDTLVEQLTSREHTNYAYKLFPKQVNLEEFPAMPFRDKDSVVIDLKLLQEYVQQHPEFGEIIP